MKIKPIVFGIMLAAVSVFIIAGCAQDTFRQVKTYDIGQFLNTTSVFGKSMSHDESKILFTSNVSGIYNAYFVPVEGGEPTALTASDSNSYYSVSCFPDDDRILLMSDQGGNEVYHIFLRDVDGTMTDLTPGEEARATYAGWSYDLKSFFYESNRRDPRYMDVYEVDIENLEGKMIFQNDPGYSFADISNDKRYMAFTKIRTTHNSDIYLYDRQEDEMHHLTPHEGDISYSPVTFSVDSKSLYYLTDENSEFSYLNRYDIASGQSELVEKADWDIMYAKFSRSGKYRVIGINNDSKTEIKIYDTENNAPVIPPTIPDADISSVSISRSEKLMTFYVNGSRSPNNLFVYDLETKEYRQLTDVMNPEIDPADLVEAEVVRYQSFDGLEIPGLLYTPYHKKGDMMPALVMVHGGPGGQARVGYSASVQYLVNHGYVVLDVNNRGSSGYGKTFFKLDDLKHGKGDLTDCVEAKKFFASTGYVDTSRVGIIGGSYGGYMTLAAMAFRPDEFAAGIDLFGISNWVRTLNSIPPWWEDFRDALYKELGNPETDEEYLRSISPLFHADKITRPLMVLQGANDPRVLKVESDEIVEAVKANGVPVEYLCFEDEGHGFVKKENRIEGWSAILKFLDQHLKGQPTTN